VFLLACLPLLLCAGAAVASGWYLPARAAASAQERPIVVASEVVARRGLQVAVRSDGSRSAAAKDGPSRGGESTTPREAPGAPSCSPAAAATAPRPKKPGYLGAALTDVPDDRVDALKVSEGAYVQSTTEGGPAALAGIDPGDVIRRLDDVEVKSAEALLGLLAHRAAGDKVVLSVLRDGEPRQATVLLAAAPLSLAKRLAAGGAPIRCVTLCREGRWVAAGLGGSGEAADAGISEVAIWDQTTGRAKWTLRADAGEICALAFSPDGKRLMGAGWRGDVVVWSLESGEPEQTFRVPGQLPSFAFSPDGTLLATCDGGDAPVRIWEIASGLLKRTFDTPEGKFYQVAFSPDGQTLAGAGCFTTPGSGSREPGVVLWNVATGAVRRSLPREVQNTTVACSRVAFSPDGAFVAGFINSYPIRRVVIWETRSGSVKRVFDVESGSVEALAFSPSRPASLLALDGRGGLDIWDIGTGARRLGVQTKQRSNRLAISTDGKCLVTSGDDAVLLWDAE
jgi:Tol biopolymer transport system component